MSMENKRLRILCLHGCGQNMDVFRQKTGSLRKKLKNYAEFEYISAPHQMIRTLTTEDTPEDEVTDQRTWWYSRAKEKQLNLKETTDDKNEVEESMSYLETVFNQKGPFDGVLGFSEGAMFLALACLLQKRFINQIKFVILVAGCKSASNAYKDLYAQKKVKIPSLHVIGETDRIIIPDRSKGLMEVFENAEVLFHPGGHYVPSSKEMYIQFLEKFLHK